MELDTESNILEIEIKESDQKRLKEIREEHLEKSYIGKKYNHIMGVMKKKHFLES